MTFGFAAVRHGVTRSNLEGKLNGANDLSLDPSAREPLMRAGSRLATLSIGRVLVSPMLRARQSAEIICSLPAFRDLDVEVFDELRELDFGDFEGLSREEILGSDLAAKYRAWMSLSPDAPSVPGGESWESALRRARNVLHEIESAEENCMVVGHGYMLRLLMVTAIGRLPPQAVWQFPMQSAAWSWLDRVESIWRLCRHNVVP